MSHFHKVIHSSIIDLVEDSSVLVVVPSMEEWGYNIVGMCCAKLLPYRICANVDAFQGLYYKTKEVYIASRRYCLVGIKADVGSILIIDNGLKPMTDPVKTQIFARCPNAKHFLARESYVRPDETLRKLSF